MSRNRIVINGITGSYYEAVVGDSVTVANDGDGTESSILWISLTGSQPSGSYDGFANSTAFSTTIQVKKEGNYLINSMVDLSSLLTGSAIIAVRHKKSNLQSPAAGEKAERSGSYGWARAQQKLTSVVDDLVGENVFVVGLAKENLQRGDLVRPSGTLLIKPGLPGEERLVEFSRVAGEGIGRFQQSLYIVEGTALTGSSIQVSGSVPEPQNPSSGSLFIARLCGLFGPFTGSADVAIGSPVFARSDGVLDTAFDVVNRVVGTVVDSPAANNFYVHFDGAAGTKRVFVADVAPVDVLTNESSRFTTVSGYAANGMRILASGADAELLVGRQNGYEILLYASTTTAGIGAATGSLFGLYAADTFGLICDATSLASEGFMIVRSNNDNGRLIFPQISLGSPGGTNPGTNYLEASFGSGSAVSPSNYGRLRYNNDPAVQKWQYSENGGAWANAFGASGSGTPLEIQLTGSTVTTSGSTLNFTGSVNVYNTGNTTVVDITAASGAYVPSWFNIVDYGASTTATGSINTAAIQSAYNAAVAASGGIVFIPRGTFPVARVTIGSVTGVVDITDVSASVTFVGEDRFNSIVKAEGDATAADFYMFYIHGGASDIGFYDFTIHGNYTAFSSPDEQSPGIQCGFNGTTRVNIHRMIFREHYGDGVRLGGEIATPTEYINITDCEFYDNQRSGVSLQRASYDVNISRCYFEGTTDQDIDCEPSGLGDIRRLHVDSCKFQRSGTLVQAAVTLSGIDGTYHLTDSSFTNNEINGGAIRIDNAQNLLVQGNHIYSGIFVTQDPVIWLRFDSSHIAIKDNFLRQDGDQGAVIVAQQDSLFPDYIDVIDNTIEHNYDGSGADLSCVNFNSPTNVRCIGNTIILNSGSTADTYYAIKYRAVAQSGYNLEFSNNHISGAWIAGIWPNPNAPYTLDRVTIANNIVDGAKYGILFGSGTYDTPPIVSNNNLSNTTSALGSFSSVPGILIGGNQDGLYSSGVYASFNTPEGQVTARVGSICQQVNGTAGGQLYLKKSGTGNTGWVAINDLSVQLTGSTVTASGSTLNFTGSVNVTNAGGVTVINIPGGAVGPSGSNSVKVAVTGTQDSASPFEALNFSGSGGIVISLAAANGTASIDISGSSAAVSSSPLEIQLSGSTITTSGSVLNLTGSVDAYNTGGVTIINVGGDKLLKTINVSASTASIDINGLDGDTHGEYLIRAHILWSDGNVDLLGRINDSTGSSDYDTNIVQGGAAVTVSDDTRWLLANSTAAHLNKYADITFTLRCLETINGINTDRTITWEGIMNYDGGCFRIDGAGRYLVTGNITSFNIYPVSGLDTITSGSTIKVYQRGTQF